MTSQQPSSASLDPLDVEGWLERRWMGRFVNVLLDNNYTSLTALQSCENPQDVIQLFEKPGHRLKMRLLLEELATQRISPLQSGGGGGGGDDNAAQNRMEEGVLPATADMKEIPPVIDSSSSSEEDGDEDVETDSEDDDDDDDDSLPPPPPPSSRPPLPSGAPPGAPPSAVAAMEQPQTVATNALSTKPKPPPPSGPLPAHLGKTNRITLSEFFIFFTVVVVVAFIIYICVCL